MRPGDLLFESPYIKNEPMSRRHAQGIIDSVGKRMGVRLYPHWFRHQRLSHMALEGLSPYELKDMAGWSSIKQCDVYVHLSARRYVNKIKPH